MLWDKFDGWAARLLGIEERTESDVQGVFQPIINRLFGFGVALWPGDDATLAEQQEATERLNVGELEEVVPRVRRTILSGAREALNHGLDVAVEEAVVAGSDVTREDLPASAKRLSPALIARVDGVGAAIHSKVVKAQTLLRFATTQTDVLESLAVAQQGVNVAKAVARQSANEASNDALTSVSRAASDVVSVWRAERNACLHCLAYQGQIDDGKGYPSGLTFAAKPISKGRVKRPPLHPNCRCTQSLVHVDEVEALADTFKREAQRSVLRGWSLPSESEKARVEAAKRLVQRGNTLPKSVNAYAQAAIKAGEFARGRTPPA